MVLYEFFVINAPGECLFYEDFISGQPLEKLLADKTETGRLKHVHGISIAVKAFAKNMSPTPINAFKSFSTAKYKYSIYDLPSGLKFILLTSVDNLDYTDVLKFIGKELFMEYVLRNPLYEKDTQIKIPAFREKVIEALKQ